MTIKDRGFAVVMAAAETVADFGLLIDFCVFASALAVAAPIAAIGLIPAAGRNFTKEAGVSRAL